MNTHAEQNFPSIASFAKRGEVKTLKLLLVNTLHESGRLIFSNILIAVEQSIKCGNENSSGCRCFKTIYLNNSSYSNWKEL